MPLIWSPIPLDTDLSKISQSQEVSQGISMVIRSQDLWSKSSLCGGLVTVAKKMDMQTSLVGENSPKFLFLKPILVSDGIIA